jgi:hypothetical protein
VRTMITGNGNRTIQALQVHYTVECGNNGNHFRLQPGQYQALQRGVYQLRKSRKACSPGQAATPGTQTQQSKETYLRLAMQRGFRSWKRTSVCRQRIVLGATSDNVFRKCLQAGALPRARSMFEYVRHQTKLYIGWCVEQTDVRAEVKRTSRSRALFGTNSETVWRSRL